jgi:hypothetical protein
MGTSVGSNLLKNGDFEEGLLSPWSQSVTNEVAINWNAPLAWLAAFADEKAQESSVQAAQR